MNNRIITNNDFNNYLKEYLETNNLDLLNNIVFYLLNNDASKIDISCNLTDINKFLFKDSNGRTLAYYFMLNSNKLDDKIQSFFLSSLYVIKECLDNNINLTNCCFKIETILSKFNNGRTVLDYLIERNMIGTKLLSILPVSLKKQIDSILINDIKKIVYLNSDVLLNLNNKGISYMEFAFKYNLITKEMVYNTINNVEIFNLCIKYNRKDLLCYIREGIFNYKFDNKTVLEYLLKNNITIVEPVFKNNETLKTIIKYKKYNLINRCDANLFINNYDLNNTNIGILLENYKKGDNIDFKTIKTNFSNNKLYALYIFEFVKRDLFNLIKLDKDDVLKLNGNHSLLYELLQINSNITINKLLTVFQKEDIEISSLLRKYGFKSFILKYKLKINNYINLYNLNIKNELAINNIDPLYQKKLMELIELMSNDGLSSSDAIETLLVSYQYLYFKDSNLGFNEINKLIEIKRNNPYFILKMSKIRSSFRLDNNSIELNSKNIFVLNHEIGHLLYHNVTDKSIPSEFELFIDKIRNNPNFIKNVQKYTIKTNEIQEDIKKRVNSYYINMFEDEFKTRRDEISSFIDMNKQLHIDNFIRRGYSPIFAKSVFEDSFNYDVFKKYSMLDFKNGMHFAISNSEYGAFIAISDIIDAITNGNYYDRNIYNDSGNFLNGVKGHGSKYYSRDIKLCFDEIIANYSSIIKSPNSHDALVYLKNIVGEEFLNFIDDYYKNTILKSNIKLEEEQKL